ncbi:MAG TPA: biopolymer transporter ExbD [Vicinamibacterales bacterium]|nr:biopolymer transporter ExbD [Vicinamibacterales bacterium]
MPKVHATGTNGGGRRGRSARVTTTLSEINVVPLVDVMLVLLIIFMVTAPMMQQGLQVNLPQARRADPVAAQPIYVTIPATFGRTQRLQIGQDEVGIEAIAERVRQALAIRDDKSVFLRMDASVTAQDIMTVTDRLKEAGVERVGFMTQPPTGR